MLGVGRRGPLGPVPLVPADPLPERGENAAPPLGALDRTAGASSDATRGGRASRSPGSAIPPAPLGDLDERAAWAVLASVDGVGPASFGSLVRRFGSASALLARAADGPAALAELPDDPDPTATRRLRFDAALLARLVVAARRPEVVLDEVAALGLSVVTLEDEAYPSPLRATELAPPVIFVLGDPAAVGAIPGIAVVGTRRPTEAGRRAGARIAGAIARAGAVVVSGLAIGIDGVAHEAALAEGGRTVAVLGAGHRHVTPAAHRGLARRIVDGGGAVVSEFPPATEPATWSFPRRNRIISGTTGATVVVEAAARSGALITAAWALEQGRECYLVPGALEDEAARGCLRFLRDHAGLARVVAGIPELLEDLGLATSDGSDGSLRAVDTLGEVPRRVAGLVAAGRGTVDELAAATGLEVASVLGALTVLELHGLVIASVGRYRPAGLLATRPPGRAGSGRHRR